MFFFSCSDHHRALHSFPTRRSSDLSARDPAPGRLPRSGKGRAHLSVRAVRRAAPARDDRHGAHLPPGALRSEEHTSELQSHVNLVCRLLLEKKKKKTNLNHIITTYS